MKNIMKLERNQDIKNNYDRIQLIRYQGFDGELRRKCIDLIMAIIRKCFTYYLQRSSHDKNFDFNLILKKPMEPVEYNLLRTMI